jgi:hypothetical protein
LELFRSSSTRGRGGRGATAIDVVGICRPALVFAAAEAAEGADVEARAQVPARAETSVFCILSVFALTGRWKLAGEETVEAVRVPNGLRRNSI